MPSHHTFSVNIFSTCMSKVCFLVLTCGCMMLTMPSTTSFNEICSVVNVNLPLSILDISKTSLISPKRCLLDNVIFLRQFSTCFLSSMWAVAIAVMPTIAFIGVRISWLIFAKKSLLALFASRAVCRAFSNSFSCERVIEKYRRKISVKIIRTEAHYNNVMNMRWLLRLFMASSNMLYGITATKYHSE